MTREQINDLATRGQVNKEPEGPDLFVIGTGLLFTAGLLGAGWVVFVNHFATLGAMA